MFAGVVELVDALDSKSSDGNIMPVRVRPSAPYFAPLELRMAGHALRSLGEVGSAFLNENIF